MLTLSKVNVETKQVISDLPSGTYFEYTPLGTDKPQLYVKLDDKYYIVAEEFLRPTLFSNETLVVVVELSKVTYKEKA